MKSAITIILSLFVFSIVSVSQEVQLREVKGHVIKSKELPAVDLEFGRDFKYAGGHRFVLYDVAMAEQHFFVDADKDGRIKRMYWVQFEGYLPTNTNSYSYKGTKNVMIDGLDFIADAYARNIKANPGRPDGDAAVGRAFLEKQGYRLGSDETLSQRLLHFIGEKKRNELMIIYIEDLSAQGLTAADVAKGGKAETKWSEMADALLVRAQKNMRLRKKS